MSHYKAYPAYKDPGVEWIGQVPEHWEATKLKYVAEFSGGGTPPKENPDYWNGSIPWISPKDMKYEVVTDSIDHITTEGLENSATKLIDSGSVLLVARSGILRHTIPVGINNVPVSLNQDMKALSLNQIRVRPRFILRWVQGFNRSLLGVWAKEGATVESLEHEYVANTPLPLPDLVEQDAILSTLDRETGRIDALIQKKTRFIELLKEKRQALITHAVTKGLDPNVKMKDSGVEWIGQVPEYWQIAQLKRLVSIQNGSDHKAIETDEGYPVYGSGGRFAYASSYMHDGESVLLGRKGTIDRPMYVNGRFWTVDTMYWTKILANADGKFFYYAATTIPFSYYATNTALPSMTQTSLGAHLMAYPPLEEQSTIAATLDRETARIDALIGKAEHSITLLKERRAAFITAAVTGQIDLRGEQ